MPLPSSSVQLDGQVNDHGPKRSYCRYGGGVDGARNAELQLGRNGSMRDTWILSNEYFTAVLLSCRRRRDLLDPRTSWSTGNERRRGRRLETYWITLRDFHQYPNTIRPHGTSRRSSCHLAILSDVWCRLSNMPSYKYQVVRNVTVCEGRERA